MAQSSSEAEYRALAYGTCEFLWLKTCANRIRVCGRCSYGFLQCDNTSVLLFLIQNFLIWGFKSLDLWQSDNLKPYLGHFKAYLVIYWIISQHPKDYRMKAF